MKRPFTTFIGIDLGGARGKTTAVTTLSAVEDGKVVQVESVRTRSDQSGDQEPWHDEAVIEYLKAQNENSVVAVDAPLVAPACIRCTLAVCPGSTQCDVPAVRWLRAVEQELEQARQNDRSRIATIGGHSGESGQSESSQARRLPPYLYRCTEIELHYQREVLHREHTGQGNRLVAARAGHLRRRLAGLNFELNKNLLEVSPRATIHSLFGGDRARHYKREADPWETRAEILQGLQPELRFAPSSRLSREEVLRNDHCFDSLIAAYTAFLWARDGWEMPQDGPFEEDGWIWAPPPKDT